MMGLDHAYGGRDVMVAKHIVVVGGNESKVSLGNGSGRQGRRRINKGWGIR
jgi:hypothetical protein